MNKIGNSKLAKNTAMQYGLQAAKYLFPFITIPYLTRVLGPDVYAVRAYVLAAMTFLLVFLDYGFNSYGTKAVAEANGDMSKIKETTSTVALLRLALCAVGAIVVVLITPQIPIMAANPEYVALAYIGVCFKAMLPDFVFQGQEDMGIITHRFIVSQFLATVLIFLIIRSPEDLLWVPVFESLAAIIAFAWSWANVLVTRCITFVQPSARMLRVAFVSSSVFFVSSAATTIFTCLTTLMIGLLVPDPAEISYWAIAMTAIAAVQSLYTPITNSLYPHMCIRKDYRLVKKLLLVGVPVVAVGTIAFACLSDTIMWLLGGEAYLSGSYVIAMVSPVLFLSFPAMLIGFPVLVPAGEVKKLTLSSVASAVFHVAGLALLATTGNFTIASIAILRCCTEAILLFIRGVFVWKLLSK